MTEAQEKRRERNRRYYEKQKAKRAQGRAVIGDAALARSRMKRAQGVPNIFAPYEPPKSVAPAMAMDSSFSDTMAWALGGLTQQTGVTGFLGYPVLAELAQRPEYRRILGIQPAGLNASSEGELECFYTWINALQEKMLSEPLRTVLGFIQLSLFGEVDTAITFSWEPLGDVSELEAAQIRKTNAETGQVLIAGKVISPEEERQRIASDDDSIYDNIDVEAAPGDRLTPIEKATIAAGVTGAIVQAEGSGLVDTPIAMEELRKLSLATGVWTSITEVDVVEAKLAPEPPAPEFPPPGGEEGKSPFDGAQDGGFNEEDHPRDDDGRFSGGSEESDDSEDDSDDVSEEEPEASTLSPREQASSIAKVAGSGPDAYDKVEEAIGADTIGAIVEDHYTELSRAAVAEAKNASPEERLSRGVGAVMDDMGMLSDRDADKMERFFAQPFTADTIGDVLGRPLADVVGRHREELEGLSTAFKDRVSENGGWAGKDSPWDEHEFRDKWYDDHEDAPSDAQVSEARKEVEGKWIRKTFGDDLSLGLKEAMANWREDPTPVMTYRTEEGARQEGDYAAPGFVRDMQRTFSGLSAADAKDRLGEPFFNVVSGMRSLKIADIERAKNEADDVDSSASFARYASLAKTRPEEAARIAPKMTERLAAHLEKARAPGA